jgi:iron(III) transport system ATP-binding protein
MNKGRIEQAGPPEEVFRRPDSEFVARFLGGTNILRGRHQGDRTIRFGAFALRAGDGTPADGDTAVSIRPHEIALADDSALGGENVLPATVLRATFLGATRDVLAAIDRADGPADPDLLQLRVNLPADRRVEVGERIVLRLPPERCRALPR